MQAAEAKPERPRGRASHYRLRLAKKGKARRAPPPSANGIGNGFLGVAYAGPATSRKLICEPGTAKKVPKGAVLIFQMHYTPDGVERTETVRRSV